MRRLFAIVAALLAPTLVAACSSGTAATSVAAAPTARLSVEGARVGATAGVEDPSMTSVFLTIVNPGAATVQLTSAECQGAGIVQLHEMVMQGGRKVMAEAKGGIPIPAGSRTALVPGGHHIMLMRLQRDFSVGDPVRLTLHFSDGGSLIVQAAVTESMEDEHYHALAPKTEASS